MTHLNFVIALDLVVAFIIGLGVTMYAPSGIGAIAGYGMAAFLAALGILELVGIVGAPSVRASLTVPSALVPRAGYLAPPGVVVNKHGSVPEIAAGTFA